MKVQGVVTVNGEQVATEVEVDEGQIIDNFVDEIVQKMTENIYTSSQYNQNPLTEEELWNIQHTITSERDYMELLVEGNFYNEVSQLYEAEINKRVKYYTFTIPYSGEIEVVVKAHNKEDAEDYIHNMSQYDLLSYVETYDIDFDESEAYLDSDSDDEPSGVEIQDATE
jgi:hypothetical protein